MEFAVGLFVVDVEFFVWERFLDNNTLDYSLIERLVKGTYVTSMAVETFAVVFAFKLTVRR